jgi:hypothetical protein
VQLTPIAEDGFISVRAVVKFATRSFTAGKYQVSVGLTHALLQLEHPSFEMENAYQATLAKETWSESWIAGRNEEKGDGAKDKTGAFALCVLRPKVGGNDPRIIATLLGASGSFQVVVTSANETPQSALQSHTEERQTEEKLRKALVDICLQRLRAQEGGGARVDTMLTGEFYLDHQEKHAPKIGQNDAFDRQARTKVNPV